MRRSYLLAFGLLLVGCSVNEERTSTADQLATTSGVSLELVAGKLGGAGDGDGIGAVARFDGPNALAPDGEGGVFVVDHGKQLRRVSASGAVTTVRLPHNGKAAPSPSRVALDGRHVFVTDSSYVGPIRLHRVEVATGDVKTWQPSWPLTFSDAFEAPIAVAKGRIVLGNGHGTLFFFDIRDGEDSSLTPIAPDRRFKSELASDGTYVYTIDGTRLVRIDVETGAVTDLDGADKELAMDAKLSGGAGSIMVFTRSGGQHLVKRFDTATGAWQILASVPNALEDGDGGGRVVESGGRLYRSHPSVNTVETLDASEVTVLAGARNAGGRDLDRPVDLTFDGQGQLWCRSLLAMTLSGWEYGLRRVDLANGAVVAPLPNVEWADSLAWDGSKLRTIAFDRGGPAGSVVDDGAMQMYSVDPTSGATVPSGFEYMSGMFGPQIQASLGDGHGNVYLAVRHHQEQQILRLAPDGRSTSWPIKASGIMPPPRVGGLALVDDDHLVFSLDADTITIQSLELSTGEVEILAGSWQADLADGVGPDAHFARPRGLAYDGKGHVYIADRDHNAVRRLDIATRAVTTVIGGGGQAGIVLGDHPRLNQPISLAFAPDGRLLITSDREAAIVAARIE